MTGDVVAEGRLLRNVIAALRQALAEHPEGCLEARLWHGVEACGVARGVFNEAIEIMFDAGWSSRRYGQLFSGPAPMGEPRLLIPPDRQDETGARMGETITNHRGAAPAEVVRSVTRRSVAKALSEAFPCSK